ncbi:hypothetical protein BXT84_03110 [Sulfobacillus thermotolerans]|uniref:Beta-lactamase-related domain-containing protein n=1 Tax=Sulfobacillus thermotolerans TaxID=338644 RepID=A0ABM6RNW8_9FIRM|nr:hypothetical protein BXT84_03110 [Sulfobacillus thermotolerans]
MAYVIPKNSHELGAMLNRAVTNHIIPGAIAMIGCGHKATELFVVGQQLLEGGEPSPMRENTLFDMASLTKVMVTLPLVLSLIEDKRLTLQDRVRDYLPEFQGMDKDSVTISQLLTHTAGLIAHREYFKYLTGYSPIVEAVMTEPLEYKPGTKIIYSDLGYILLGEIVQRVTKKTLHNAAEERVFSRLGMVESGYKPSESLRNRIAATEVMKDGRAKVGIVHDDNAEAMGGESGHAGLFSTVYDVMHYVMEWSEPSGKLLCPATITSSLSFRTKGLNGYRALGWVLRGDAHDVLGNAWPATSASHTGYTGTSIAFDIESHYWVILLTNRVHLGRQNDITELRHQFHKAAISVLMS